MRKTWSALFLLAAFMCHADDTIVAEKESLEKISIGTGPIQVQYNSTEEGFYSPGSPTIDDKGTLWFSPYGSSSFLIFEKGHFASRPYPSYFPQNHFPSSYSTVNQDGVFGYYSGNPYEGVLQWEKANFTTTHILRTRTTYRLSSGFLVEIVGWNKATHKDDSYLVSVERIPNGFSMTEDKKGKFVFRNPEVTKSWLPTQPGGFTIGDDGLLYRNGMVWSAIRPKGKENYDVRFIGRLMSGHTIWAPGPPEVAVNFYIVDSRGNIELEVKIPSNTRFDYGVGPWGELYYLFAPPMDKRLDPMNDYYKPEPGVPAELAVFRTHLKYFGRLNDGGVRLRKEPNTTSQILGTYPNKTGFRILERTGKDETIGGATSDWVKVRLLDGKEGWFFGAFVHNLYDGPNDTPPPWPNVPDW